MDSPILQTVIGLVFIFATFAALVSLATEGVSRFIGLRGEYLLRGIRSLVDGESTFELSWWKNMWRSDKVTKAPDAPAAVSAIMSHPLVAGSAAGGSTPEHAGNSTLTRQQLKALPSYVSSRTFASTVLDLVIPNKDDKGAFADIEAKLDSLPYGDFKKRLLPPVRQAGGDVDKLRKSLEELYDDHMARVSGWYKRHVRWISLGLAAVFAVLFNLNAIEVGRTLSTDQSVRDAVVAQADKAAQDGCRTDDPQCFEDVQKAVRDAQNAGIPIGWATAEVCTLDGADCNLLESKGILPLGGDASDDFWALVALVLGWALMAAATVPGARFWIDSLSKLGSIRSTGPKPATSTDGGG
jgi:hypothetical protein